MAPKKKTSAKRSAKKASTIQVEDKIVDAHLDDIAKQNYYDYGISVIEDRAIYGEIDGLKPVARRLLWAAYNMTGSKFMKSARIVGEAMGKYHPHGDSAIYGALITAVRTPCALFYGSGNWGSMADPAAAMRYTESKLSAFSEAIYFDKFYLPTVDFVPNYDGQDVEPLILPSLLPAALTNGNFGIAPGINTRTPSFTFNSLLDVLQLALKDKHGAYPENCEGLDMITESGGVLRKTKTLKDELKAFYETGKANLIFDSVYEEVDSHSLRFHKFAFNKKVMGQEAAIDKVLFKVESIKGVTNVRDDSRKNESNSAYVVTLSKSLNGPDKTAVIRKVVEAFSVTYNFNVQVTERYLDEKKPDGAKQLKPSTTPDIINSWIEYRVGLEKRACEYWIVKRQEQIAYIKLMRLAVKNRSFIIKALDKDLNDEKLAEYIAKGLKITVEQANQILDLRVRQLKALEDKKLKEKLAELEAEISSYNARIAKPKAYISKQLDGFRKLLGGELA